MLCLKFSGVFDRFGTVFGAETIENGAETGETIGNGAETIENGVVFDRFLVFSTKDCSFPCAGLL